MNSRYVFDFVSFQNEPGLLQQALALAKIGFPFEDLRSEFLAKNNKWWICCYKYEVVGFAGFDTKKNLLNFSCVALKHRGQGIHKQFVKIRKDFGEKQGALKIIAFVAAQNVASANNYIKSGFSLSKSDVGLMKFELVVAKIKKPRG